MSVSREDRDMMRAALAHPLENRPWREWLAAVLADLDAVEQERDKWRERTEGLELERQMFARRVDIAEATLANHDARPWMPTDGDKRCERCGSVNAVWFTDDALWRSVMPGDGVLCIACFIREAESQGVRPTAWRVADPRAEGTSGEVGE